MIFYSNNIKLAHNVSKDIIYNLVIFQSKILKVKVMTLKIVENTFLAITSVLIKIETRNKNHFVPLRELYHIWPWNWQLTLTLFLAPKVNVDLTWPFFEFFNFGHCILFYFGSSKIPQNLSRIGQAVFE